MSGRRYGIQRINSWLDQGGLTEGFKREKAYKPVKLRKIVMSAELSESLDYPSKLDRSEAQLSALTEDGERQAELFLDDLDGHEIRPSH